MARIFLALGANLGNPTHSLAKALLLLGEVVRLQHVSSVYRSAPVGVADQPDFFNLVGVAETILSPEQALQGAHAVERALGRVRTLRNGPRTIDIDILAYDELILDTPDLTLPHPRMTERAFVLVPLVEIAPGWRHPLCGRTAAELLADAGPLERIERWGPPPRVT